MARMQCREGLQLLHTFGLDSRLVNTIDDLESILEKEINYEPIDLILDKERDRTLHYLSECIKDCAKD